MNLKVLLLGSSGLVGSRFVELSPYAKLASVPTHEKLDLTDRNSVWAYLQNNKFDIIINFAAYTNVGEGEKQRNDKNGDCWKINVSAVENILQAIDSTTHFIQISTDYVFKGDADDRGPYPENHAPEENSEKITWYGFTKAEAERLIKANLGDQTTILRIIYPVRARFNKKLDYLRKPLKLFDEGKLYPLFTDQQVSISFIDEVCEALNIIISRRIPGVYHACSSDISTPYDLVSYLIQKIRGSNHPIEGALISDFLKQTDSPTRYQKYGGLNSQETSTTLGQKFSSCLEIIDKLIDQGLN